MSSGSNWMAIILAALLGVVVTGAGMVVRGDFLGAQAAKEAEQRLEKRMDKVESDFRYELQEVRAALRRIEAKLDEKAER